MNRPMPAMRAKNRFHSVPAEIGRELGQFRLVEIAPRVEEFSVESGSERADRLVRPEAAAHYMRQGERLAAAVMAVTSLVRRIAARLHSGASAGIGA